MTTQSTRREILTGSLALAGLSALGIPDWILPALAQGETIVPFADMPENLPAPRAETRIYDVRKIDGPFTPKAVFPTTQHYGHPSVDPATFRLKVTGMVDRPKSLSLDDLRKMGSVELIAGFECSGNRRPLQGLSGNGRWTGVPLRTVLERSGVRSGAIEVMCEGHDRGTEEDHPEPMYFARSLPLAKALDAFKSGSAQVSRAAFMTGMANTLYDEAQLFGPRKLDDPEKAKVFSNLASTALKDVPETKQTKELIAKIQTGMKKK